MTTRASVARSRKPVKVGAAVTSMKSSLLLSESTASLFRASMPPWHYQRYQNQLEAFTSFGTYLCLDLDHGLGDIRCLLTMVKSLREIPVDTPWIQLFSNLDLSVQQKRRAKHLASLPHRYDGRERVLHRILEQNGRALLLLPALDRVAILANGDDITTQTSPHLQSTLHVVSAPLLS
jgi:hypothetical protein